MKRSAETLAAAVAAVGAVLAAPAMAQEAAETNAVFTTEEAASVKDIFKFEGCMMENTDPNLEMAAMFGAISEEEYEAAMSEVAAVCESETGLSEQTVEAAVDALEEKYGAQNVEQTIANSYDVIYPASEFTEQEIADINLVHDFTDCAAEQENSYIAIDDQWHIDYENAIDGGMSKEEAEALVGPHPDEPDIQSICLENLGITDVESAQERIDDLVGKHGQAVLMQRPGGPAPN